MRHRLRTSLGVLAIAGVLAITGCGGSGDSSADVYSQAEAPKAESGGSAADAEAGGPGSGDVIDPAGRYTIITGSVIMESDDPIVAGQDVSSLVLGAGGRIDAREQSSGTEYSGAYVRMTLRIPEDSLNDVLDTLSAAGTVSSMDLTSQDVTAEVVDLDARIASKQASVDRMRTLMGEATTVADLLSIETQLSERESELEALKAQKVALADQVSYATIEMTISTAEDDAPPPEEDEVSGFLGGLESGWNGFLAFGTGLLTVLGVLLPWLLVLVPAIWLTVFLTRRWRAKHPKAPRVAPTVYRYPQPDPLSTHAYPGTTAQASAPQESPSEETTSTEE